MQVDKEIHLEIFLNSSEVEVEVVNSLMNQCLVILLLFLTWEKEVRDKCVVKIFI